ANFLVSFVEGGAAIKGLSWGPRKRANAPYARFTQWVAGNRATVARSRLTDFERNPAAGRPEDEKTQEKLKGAAEPCRPREIPILRTTGIDPPSRSLLRSTGDRAAQKGWRRRRWRSECNRFGGRPWDRTMVGGSSGPLARSRTRPVGRYVK